MARLAQALRIFGLASYASLALCESYHYATENVGNAVKHAIAGAVNGVASLLEGDDVMEGLQQMHYFDPALPQPGDSSQDIVSDRIVGGSPAPEQIEPFAMVLEQVGDSKFFAGCGSAVISRRFVITAAHCIFSVDDPNRKFKNDFLFLGAWKPWILNGPDVPYQIVGIEWFKLHELYNMFTYEYDAAIFKIDQDVDITKLLPAEMADVDYDLEHGAPVKVYGFGYREEIDEGEEPPTPPDVLQEVRLKLVDQENCQTSLADNTISDDMICAYRGAGYDSCGGDSGGPMFSDPENGEDPVLVGIVSHGIGCGRKGLPGVYARVDKVRPFLTDIICKDPDELAAGLPPFCGGLPWKTQATNEMIAVRDRTLDTNAPTPSPTPSCRDYESAFLIVDWVGSDEWRKADCAWVAEKTKRCKKSKIVRQKCPRTCNKC